MATKKTQTLEERLAERKIVNFDRGLIGSLDESTIRELVEDYIKHPTQSVGQRFVAAMESVYRNPVLAEGDNGIDVNATVNEIVAIIDGSSTSQDGTSITVGRRSDKKVFYLRWSSQMQETGAVKIRDPFTRNGILERYVEAGETKYIGSEPYDAQVADGDGALVIEQDLYVLLCLSWETREAQPASLAHVNDRLLQSEEAGKEVKASDVSAYFPQAHRRLVELKGQKRGRDWQRYVDSLMDLEAPSSSMPPFGGAYSTTVGARGVNVGGHVGGSIVTGDGNRVSGGASQRIGLTLEVYKSLGLTARQYLAREVPNLAIMGDVQSRLTVFANGLTRFRGSIDASSGPTTFTGILINLVERYGDPGVWLELMELIIVQPDASPELRYFIANGSLPGQGDVVKGTQINMPGDFRGAQINIGTNITGSDRK